MTHAPSGDPEPIEAGPARQELATKVGRAGLVMAARRVIVMAVLALGSIFVARFLEPSSFGAYAAGLGTVQLLLALADFGFTQFLARELARESGDRGPLVRGTWRVQTVWSVLPFLAAILLAASAGLGTERGQVILVTSPVILAAGLASVRQVYLAIYEVGFISAVDVSTNLASALTTTLVAALTGDPVLTAGAFALCTLANSIVVAQRGFGLVGPGRPRPRQWRWIVTKASPLGVASVLSSAYFTIDLVLLGWLVSGQALGEYAVAVKFLSLIVAVPTLLASIALPGLSSTLGDRSAMSHLAARTFHWQLLVGLPLCTGAAVFAEPVTTFAFGEDYAGAAPAVRVLALAGAASLLASLLSTLLMATYLVVGQLVTNLAALILNVAANLLLVPRFGTIASAWITVATEVFVIVSALWLLRDRFRAPRLAASAWKPLIAAAGLASTGLVLASFPLIGIACAALVYVAITSLLKDWPEEFRGLIRLPRGQGT